jgi:hypothetical protein
VRSIFVQDDILFSGSWDGSVKSWTIVRAVELNSFRDFDDRVSAIMKADSGLLVGMTNQLIEIPVDSRLLEIHELSGKILELMNSLKGIVIATKSINALYVHSYKNSRDVANIEFVLNGETCTAVYTEPENLQIWFGLSGGGLVKFSSEESAFSLEVRSSLLPFVATFE